MPSRWIDALRARLRALLNPRPSDDELREELSFHLAMDAHAEATAGANPGEAERRARLRLGGAQQLTERLRDVRSCRWLDETLQDLRYAVRTILRTKLTSLAVVVTFALGIGANAAIFSLVNSVLLTPLPYATAGRIVAVEPFWTNTGRTNPVSSTPDFRDWREQNHVFEHLAYYAGREGRTVVDGVPSFASLQLVTPEFFDVFGAAPVAGRVWKETDAHAPMAIVSHRWALAHFGDAASAIGRTVTAVGAVVQIVGVAPGGFTYPASTDIWLTHWMFPDNSNRSAHNFFVVGNLKEEVTLEQARAQMRAIADRLERQYPENRSKSIVLTPLREKLTGDVRPTLWLLFGAVLGVLLIACVNVAHLQLVRAASRGREMAIRGAIGADRFRIARQVLTESVVLGLLGCILGLAAGYVTLRAFLAVAPPDIPRLNEIHLNVPVLVFTLAVTMICSVSFAIGPVRSFARAHLSAVLRSGAGTKVVGSIAPRVRSALVIAEVALSIMLVIGAGLLLRSFSKLAHVDLGFATERVLIATTGMPVGSSAQAQRATDFYRDLLTRIRGVQGVDYAAGVRTMPFAELRSSSGYGIDGLREFTQQGRAGVQLQVVTPSYFDTVGTALRRGRDFDDGDEAGRPLVAIVNERLAREVSVDDPGNLVGRIIHAGMDPESMKGMRIVGVVADARQLSPDQPAQTEVYLPYRQHPGPASTLALLARTSRPPEAIVGDIRSAAHALDSSIPVRFSTMEDTLNSALSYPRFRTVLVTSFALLALALAFVGVYGVLSYLVAERTPEIGVRLALGASRREIFRHVIGGSLPPVLYGLIVGLVVTFGVARTFQALLFDVSARDPLTAVAAVGVLLIASLGASSVPALRAASLDPHTALRQE